MENRSEAIYLLLYRTLREEIIRGEYPYGSKLPSRRSLAAERGVSTVTAEHALELLCDEGYIETRRRSGSYVCFRQGDSFAAPSAGERPPKPEEAGAGSGERFPISVLLRTMRRVMSERSDAILERSPNAGLPELREAIARYLARSRGIHVTAEQIVLGSGAEYLYGMVVQLLGADRVYGIESPSYQKIARVYAAENVRCEHLPLGRDGIESAALAATGADILHVTPYRSFPSGVTASASKRHAYLRWAEQGERWLIEDDFESEFSLSAKPRETLFANAKRENVIYLNTFSMTISPAIRAAYMVLPGSLLSRFAERLGFYSCTVPTFEQLVLTELIAAGDFERQINRVRRKKRREAQRGADA